MERSLILFGYNKMIESLTAHALSQGGKALCGQLRPLLSEIELEKQLRDTTQARMFLDLAGTPPLPLMEGVEEYLDRAVLGELLAPEQIGAIGQFLTAVSRLKRYLEKGQEKQIGLAFYGENLDAPEELREEIARCIRGDEVDDYASAELREIRRQLQLLEEKVREKAEQAKRASQTWLNDSFVVTRNGRFCLPVRAEYKAKVPGTVVDKSATGATLFIEPKAVGKLQEEYEWCRIAEDSEERRILYALGGQIADLEPVLREDIRVITMLDFVFAKGKLSQEMDGIEPVICQERRIRLKEARHPMLEKETVVPLDFDGGDGVRGVVITGPNTGGKTVALKTVALLCAMAGSGLHIPCKEAKIPMHNQFLCDIGDGQDMENSLSTFSAHMKNVLEILRRADADSLVILDELGSGTDPAEGMGIAIAILEELRQSGCLFFATTHYPEVKEYANRHPEVINARMAFDRESLRPLYRLEIGKAGDSCALYIAKQLGVPARMLKMAAEEAYETVTPELYKDLKLDEPEPVFAREKTPSIRRRQAVSAARRETAFTRGDSVTVLTEGKVGIVVTPEDEKGNVLVQIQKEKKQIPAKRLKLLVAAAELYPEDYDFSIIFDTVENRKARHQMEKRHQEGLTIVVKPQGISGQTGKFLLYYSESRRKRRRFMEQTEQGHKRRVRYKGTHPRTYQEKYKELQPEKYPETIAHVIQKGGTPVGMHISICVDEILTFLNIQPGQKGLDATLGYGGHTKAMLECLQGQGHICGLDVDTIEMEKTKKRLAAQGFSEELVTVHHLNFAHIDQIAAQWGPFDFVLADLGVSSMQIDNPERGFSYKKDGPLDLRLDSSQGISAAERLKTISREELAGMLWENSDEPYAEEIARAVTSRIRKGEAMDTTGALRQAVAAALSHLPEKDREEAVKKSCQRTFQALRIDINQEFEVLYQFLEKLPDALAPGGRAAILTFHSGEDRMVKKSFKQLYKAGVYASICEDVIRPSAEECARNSRAKCTKMRWAVRA